MENFTMRETHSVNKTWLPSKGVIYPDNIEIFVSPVTIRERRLLEGASQSDYYRKLLEGITIKGGPFSKTDLLLADVQFLDLVRRIYSFELDKKITITDYPCDKCHSTNTKVQFMFTDIEFEDMPEDIFKTVKTYTDNETGEEKEVELPGKIYKFSDGMEVLVSPITVGEYIELAVKYLANISENKLNEKVADLYIGQFTYLIKKVIDREYKDDKTRREFLEDYIGNIYSVKDEELLEEIEKDTTSILKPIKAICPDCGAELEVYVQPSYRFQQ